MSASFFISVVRLGLELHTFVFESRQPNGFNNLPAPLMNAILGEDLAGVPLSIGGFVLGLKGLGSTGFDQDLAIAGLWFGLVGLASAAYSINQDVGCESTAQP